MAILADLEVTLGETGDGSAMSINDVDGDVDEAGFDPESGHLWRGTALDRGLGEQRGSESERGELHRWVSLPATISSGKGSPAAQTAPSTKYSFFQMGTVFLRVSISQRQASK